MGNMTTDTTTLSHQSTLQRILTTAVNELGNDATVAVVTQQGGPLVPQVSRGFTEREVRAIFRALSLEEWGKSRTDPSDQEKDHYGVVRLRMVSPGAKVLLAIPLRHNSQLYGVLVIGKREGALFTKREKAAVESAAAAISDKLRQANLFDTAVILGRPLVAHEPLATVSSSRLSLSPSHAYTNALIQERIARLLEETHSEAPFDRAWVTLYDPLAASLEVLGGFAMSRKDLLPGQRLPLDESASGWAVRHRKPRIDHNLASTQGRFQDYRQLYRDRFQCTLVVPFFVRGRVAGTVTLASKTSHQYESPEIESRNLDPLLTRLVALFEDPATCLSLFTPPEPTPLPTSPAAEVASSELSIRRQERQAALTEVSSLLATEIREPIGYVRAQLEEVTGEGHLDFESQTRIEAAMRDLIRTETLLHEILDFTKPLHLERRICRVPELLDTALSLIATDLKINRITVIKEYSGRLGQVRWDETQMQHAFLSIFKNALEAMSPGGQLRLSAAIKRGRQSQVVIKIHNDGDPIPEELLDKVFEPYFTTKRSGTGLGLAMAKKIVEAHQGHIAIESGPETGTTVILTLPALRPRGTHRHRGGGRRHRGTSG
ncbi:MAG: hypothetical protein D6704_09260 [Nitrospirae bacterium]|nr:MAG: hypothetical protein D6704_09260 [Nitrospirota bacterium]